LRDGPLRATEAVLLTRTLALTLGYLRHHHLTQPNLTPTTILLTDKNDPKLFDLELTDVVEKWDVQKRVHAMRPAFSAPEDLAGGSIVSMAADVYRIGATMYAMLTGQPPFAGDVREIITLVAHETPAPVRQLNPAVPRDVEAVCLKCLEKRPERRYASLQELADALARLARKADAEWRT
jgi:eukaryotic-like serine/threonine-protein kinase